MRESTIVNKEDLLTPGGAIRIFDRRTWKQAFKDKAILISFGDQKNSFGYKVFWYLWSADVWFGKFPLLKFIVGINILLWILHFII